MPSPLTALGGRATFSNPSLLPFEYPALQGSSFNDSGDLSIPYFNNQSERDLLPQISRAIRSIISKKVGEVYVFPDELRLLGNTNNGDIQSSVSLTPYSDDNTRPSVDVRAGDLLVVELEANNSATGFIEVGATDVDKILAPRFKAPVPNGHFIKYNITDYFYANYSTSGVGIGIKQENLNPTFKTTFTLSFNNVGLKYNNLITFFEGSTVAPFYNRFKIKEIGQAGGSIYIEFHYDGANWYTYAGDTTIGRNLVSSITQISDYKFEIISTNPVLSNAQWTTLDGISNYFPNTFDTINSNFDLEGDTDVGVDYAIDLFLSDSIILSKLMDLEIQK